MWVLGSSRHFRNFFLDAFEELLERDRPLFACSAAHGDAVRFLFLFTDNEQIWNALPAGTADLAADRIGLEVDSGANLFFAQLIGDFCSVFFEFFADREDSDLFGCQPSWESSCVVLDQDSEEPFEGAEQCTVHHVGLVFLPSLPI